MRIGVFDSGLGGVTVLKELITRYPNNEYIYFGDTINLPYGSKTKEQLLQFSDKIINFLKEQKVDLIIIACGTCSANTYFEIKDKYHIPIIDILSPTIHYILSCEYKKIGVIGTEMLIKSNYFNKYLNNVEVTSVATPKLVPLIETDKINTDECEEVLKQYLNNFNDIDALVLGCTHYSLLKDQILKIRKLKLINMGEILSHNINLGNSDELKVTLYFSFVNDTIQKKVQQIFANCQLYEKKL